MRLFGNVLRGLDRLAGVLLFDVLFSRRWRGWTLVALALALLAWLATGSPPAAAPAGAVQTSVDLADEHLLARPWIDRRPQNLKDPFCIYVFDKRRLDRHHFLGIYVFGNSLKHTFEFFGYQVKNGKVHFWFPNDDGKFESAFSVERERSGRYDLRLKLSADPRHDGRPFTYWGRTDGDLQVPAIEKQLGALTQGAVGR